MNDPFVLMSESVEQALAGGGPVVALETSVLAQGLPAPRNLEAAEAMEAAIRVGGAEPAWVWIDDGALRLGLDRRDLVRLALSGQAAKATRRDLPMAVAGGGLGATTVSATLWTAHRAGVEVMATGGIGGVHLRSGDVSADLFEMARTAGTVVCSGPKSIVDPAATLEKLEELSIGVLGYRCERLPFFLVRESPFALEHRARDAAQVATIAKARNALGLETALLVCNPVPAPFALDASAVEAAVEECVGRAEDEGVTGKAVTPYLLSCLAERTGGASLEANLALLEANARLAAEVAVALA